MNHVRGRTGNEATELSAHSLLIYICEAHFRYIHTPMISRTRKICQIHTYLNHHASCIIMASSACQQEPNKVDTQEKNKALYILATLIDECSALWSAGVIRTVVLCVINLDLI